MSIVQFKSSITPLELFKWKSTNNSIITQDLITVYPGGSIEYSFIPLNDEDKFITTKYRLVIKYKTINQKLSDGITCLFDMIMITDGSDTEDMKYQTIGVRALSVDDSKVCDVIFNTKGGQADSFKFQFRNNGVTEVEIESIELLPSYELDDDTITTVQQMLPTLTHASNLNPITVTDKELLLVRLKAGTTEDTSLSIHCLINGWCSEPTTATVYLIMNDTALQFSPMKVDLQGGNFLISIPACIMRVKSGGNELKVLMKVDSGVVIIEAEKVQCSLEGKGLIQGGGSARPGAYVTERYTLKRIKQDKKLKTRNSDVVVTLQKPKEVIIAEINNIIHVNQKQLIVNTSFDIELNHR